jgi:hypothetical protein
VSDQLSLPASKLQDPAITTTDILKLVGVLAFLIDHTGLFFDPDENWWRVFGRVAAPIFFFLIGFARSRKVPWTWLAFGIALTVLDSLSFGSGDLFLNILLHFALLRFVLLPLAERFVMPYPWAAALVGIACVPLIGITDEALEYGSLGWIWALFGLSRRLALAHNHPQAAWIRNGLALLALPVYIWQESHDFQFGTAQIIVLSILITLLVLALLRFRREALPWQPPPVLLKPIHLGGRYSLEIYAFSLFAMHALAYAIMGDGGADGDTDDEAA